MTARYLPLEFPANAGFDSILLTQVWEHNPLPDILREENRSEIFLSPRLNQQYASNLKKILSTINSS